MADIITFPARKLTAGTAEGGTHAYPDQARMEAIRNVLGSVFEELAAIQGDLADRLLVANRSPRSNPADTSSTM